VTIWVLRAGDLEARFEPAYGMVCFSLRHRGDELLAERRGLEEYKRSGSTMGIPLLHPWANRLGAASYSFGGREVRVEGSRVDEHGLPIHGLLAALRGWETVRESETQLVAGKDVRGLASFPFDHRIELAATLDPDRLRLETTLSAFDVPVPICFGHHPYFQLPGMPRAEWEIAAPVRERLLLDDHSIPTGERVPAGDLDGPLGTRTFDDAFTAPEGVFAVSGGARVPSGNPSARRRPWRRIEVAFERGYPYAQIFAPDNLDAVCFEPMTAPADALRHAPDAVAPGTSFTAAFSVAVSG
jgi:aldose 1-epimerase